MIVKALNTRTTLVMAIFVAMLSLMASSQAAIASTNDFGEAAGEFEQGRNDGRRAGADDAERGTGFNIDCPRNGLVNPLYCAGYDAGYVDGYASPR